MQWMRTTILLLSQGFSAFVSQIWTPFSDTCVEST